MQFDSTIVPMLQASLAPVTVISGAALLLSSMTVRYGRTVDRIRTLLREYAQIPADSRQRTAIYAELCIIYRRARLIRTEIVLVASGIFCVSLTIFALFANLVYDAPLAGVAQFLFLLSLSLLIASMGFFIADIVTSLKALKVNINSQLSVHDVLAGRRPEID